MKTITVTEARQKLGSWLARAIRGEDIGILFDGKVVALRPVQVYSEDYALMEYGVGPEAMKRVEKNILKKFAFQKPKAWSGNIKSLRG